MLAGVVVSVSARRHPGRVHHADRFLCVALLLQRDFWKPALVLLCILTAIALGAASQFESVQKRFDESLKNDNSKDERQLYWEAAWQSSSSVMFPGASARVTLTWSFLRFVRGGIRNRPQYAHNGDYLNTLCEWGVIGTAMGGCRLRACSIGVRSRGTAGACGGYLLHDIGSASSATGRPLSLEPLWVCWSVMLHCIVESTDADCGLLAATAVTLMALLAAQARFATERYWRNPGRLGKVLLLAVCVATIDPYRFKVCAKGRKHIAV